MAVMPPCRELTTVKKQQEGSSRGLTAARACKSACAAADTLSLAGRMGSCSSKTIVCTTMSAQHRLLQVTLYGDDLILVKAHERRKQAALTAYLRWNSAPVAAPHKAFAYRRCSPVVLHSLELLFGSCRTQLYTPAAQGKPQQHC